MSKQVRFDANKTASDNNLAETSEKLVPKTQSLDNMTENLYIGDVYPSKANTDLYQSGDMPVPMPSASKKNPADSSDCWFYHNSLPEDLSKSAKALRASKFTPNKIAQNLTAEGQFFDTREDQQRNRNPMQSSNNFLAYDTNVDPSRYGKSAKALKAARLHPNNIAQKLAAGTPYFDTREEQQRNKPKLAGRSSANFLSHDSLPEDASKSRIELKKRIREDQYKYEPKQPVVATKNSHECIFGTSQEIAYKPGKKVFVEPKPELKPPVRPSEVKQNYRRQMAGSSMSYVMGGDQ